jgi:hypothetical protein
MKKMILLLVAFVASLPSLSTHLRAGYVSVERLSPTTLLCRVTVTAYISTGSPIGFGGGTLSFGDGLSVEVPQTGSVSRPELGPGVGVATYSVEHLYAGIGSYIISYTESNRNHNIINLENSATVPFRVETFFQLDPFLGLFNTPEFLVEPFFSAKAGASLSLSAAAVVQSDDQFITYQVTTPAMVSSYHLPENFQINPANGLITWDTKYQGGYVAGEYVFTIKVNLWKRLDNALHRLCTVSRDYQIVLIDSEEESLIWDNIELDENNRIYLADDDHLSFKIFYSPSLADQSALIAYSDLNEQPEVLSFSTYDSAEANIRVGVLTLNSKPFIQRNSPYIINVRGQFLSDGGPLLASDLVYLFYTRDLYPDIITRTEDELSGIEVYPNPVSDYLHIDLANRAAAGLMILDSSGKVVLKRLVHGQEVIDFGSMRPGVYFCRLVNGESSRVIRIVKH